MKHINKYSYPTGNRPLKQMAAQERPPMGLSGCPPDDFRRFPWGATLLSENYWQPPFHVEQPDQSNTQPAVEDKAKETAPKIDGRNSTVNISDGPNLGEIEAALEMPQTPASTPITMEYANTEIRVKEVVAVEKGAKLFSLAHRYYQSTDQTFVDHILKLNPEITNPNLILVSQKIKIPEITDSLLLIQTSERFFRVHLRTFSNKKSADKFRRDSASVTGKNMEIVPWKVSPTETWYRVMAGSFATKDEGLKFMEEIKQNGFSIIPR